jgi:transposase
MRAAQVAANSNGQQLAEQAAEASCEKESVWASPSFPDTSNDMMCQEIGMTRTRRSFTDEFKREAVKLCKQPGATVTHIARDLGIQTSVLRWWVTQERGGVLDLRPNRPLRSEAATEVERLQRELRRVTTERDILKKALGYFAKDPQ